MIELFKMCDKGEAECGWKTENGHCLLGAICEVEFYARDKN